MSANPRAPRQVRRFAARAEVAVYIGVDVRTVYRWITDGDLPAYQPRKGSHRLLRIDLDDVDRLFERVPSANLDAS